jgi:hypothetical protein
MAKPSLPNEFNDLEPFAGWALPTERERNHKRINSQMSEIQALYDTMVPRMGAIMEYLNKLPIDGMPEDAQRLFDMTLSLAEVAPAVEFYQQPRVIDGFPAERFIPIDVSDMTPT